MSTDILCPHCHQYHRSGARFCPATGKPIQPTGLSLTGRLPTNTLLKNHYLILEKIGQGGMAAVYRAADTWQPGAIWAIKEMSDSELTDAVERAARMQAFHREADILKALNHPNLPKVVESFTEGGKHYLVMEFLPGYTLGEIMQRRSGPFPETEVLSYATQLCDVLFYLHSQNPAIIFRDLKPGNIMVTPQGQVKLIDFGIVRFFKPGKPKDTHALGTEGYVAPEAYTGFTDARSDIYSLCVTMHQLLTGYDPKNTPWNLPTIRQLNPTVTVGMEQTLARGMQMQREQRWSNTIELRGALTKVSAGLPTPMPDTLVVPLAPATLIERPKPPSRPTTKLIYMVTQLSPAQLALLLGGILVALVAATWLLTPAVSQLPINWELVPAMAIFGAFGYAALPKRGVAFLAHAALSLALVSTIWLRLGVQHYTYWQLTLAAVLSGLVIEVWGFFSERIKGSPTGRYTWLREIAWLAGMGMLAGVFFMGLLTSWRTGYMPVQILLAAAFGAVGWFLGDLIRQAFLYRKTGTAMQR